MIMLNKRDFANIMKVEAISKTILLHLQIRVNDSRFKVNTEGYTDDCNKVKAMRIPKIITKLFLENL